MMLPEVFCWTKYGTEAGEDIRAILRRKEVERQANDGLFLWGIGNSVAPSIDMLLGETAHPSVVFTPMLARAASKDVSPTKIVRWHRGAGLDGTDYDVPAESLVTSRLSPSRSSHFALVCHSELPIVEAPPNESRLFTAAHVANLRSGSRVGSSQVTSVVRRIACAVCASEGAYCATFVAELVAPYFVRLTERSLVGETATV